MCKNIKDCSCGCPVETKQLKEAVEVNRISNDMISISNDNPVNPMTLDVERFGDGSITICINEQNENKAQFDNISELVSFMGNESTIAWGTKEAKALFFTPEALSAISELTSQETINESKTAKKITIIANDSEGTIENIIKSIEKIGNGGHGFEIEMDKELASENEEAGIKTHFYWDGDGGDKIIKISVEDENEKADMQDINEAKKPVTMDQGQRNVYNLFLKHFRLLKKYKKLASASGQEKFTGFTKEEVKLNGESQSAKNEAWALSRRENIDTNKTMELSKKAENEVNGTKKIQEAEDYDYYMNWSNELKRNGYTREAEKIKEKALLARAGKIKDGEIVEHESYSKVVINEGTWAFMPDGYEKTLSELQKIISSVRKLIAGNPDMSVKDLDITFADFKESNWEIVGDDTFYDFIDEAQKELKSDNFDRAHKLLLDAMQRMKALNRTYSMKSGLQEASKINLKLSSNAKRELIKKARVALDSIYEIYDMLERLGVESKPFVDQLDAAFEGTNEVLTFLVTTDSISPSKK